MNLLSQCTPGPYTVNDHTKDEECIYVEAPHDAVATIFSSEDSHATCLADAQLLAHAYDAALFAAAAWTGDAKTYSERGGIVLQVWNGRDWMQFFHIKETDFGTPDLTPEARQALREAVLGKGTT